MEPRAEVAAAGLPGAAAGGSETVLVVEDEPAVRAVVTRVLRERGYTVLDAASGREALEAVAGHQGRIDLVIADVVMPEMDGYELAAQLAELWPGLPVLFTSGHPGADAAERAQPGPEHVLLEKPLAPDVLAATVRRLLDATGAPGARS